ncbi:DUF885 family protein [Gemmatimonadota bacterium]
MPSLILRRGVICLAVIALATASCTTSGVPAGEAGSSYEDLVSFFEEWRVFQAPNVVDGVPDYSAEAMANQHRELASLQSRLAAFDTTGWSVAQQVDYYIVWAEMNGLDFDHRVMRPWARNPAFYNMVFLAQSDVPAHEGPVVHGWIDVWTYEFPLSSADAAELGVRLRTIPALLDQARENLVEDARDLWMGGIRSMTGQATDLSSLANRVAGSNAELEADIVAARVATNEFREWLEREAPSKSGPSGVGIENYNWYLKNVHLVPYTWAEEMTVLRRDLARSFSALKLEEHHNRNLPELPRVASSREYDRRFNAAVTDYMAFLGDQEIVSIREYMDNALRERIGSFSPTDGLRGFFSEVSYREPIVMRTHGYHWFDLAMMANDPHESPIRRVPGLYNSWDSRAEGIATGMEEWMMHAGFLDGRPRARELIHILVAQRAARGIAGLRLHSNEFSMEQATEFAADWTPRGWMPRESNTVWGEQYLYLQQPYYGASYLMGKYQVEMFMAERARQLGDEFTVKRFFDEINGAGLIPMSLIRWELSGQADEIIRLAGEN